MLFLSSFVFIFFFFFFNATATTEIYTLSLHDALPILLARYNRAVGLRALVRGLQAQKGALEQRVLTDSRIDLYAGGRADVANDRVNVRVLALVLYMAEAHGQVTVSCLISGHRLYARPGVVSAHIYGLAVDIAGLEGQSILGHQQAGGLAERAVRNILLLPAELQPKQVISLLGLEIGRAHV